MMINSEEIPIGYRFTPTDEELTMYYLQKKVEGEDMTWFSHVISEQDLYGELPPWVIFDQCGGHGEDDRIRYFYTRLKKKHDMGVNIQRTVGKNEEYCWDGTTKGVDIYDHRTMTVIGKKKQYSFICSNQKKGRVAAANGNSTKKRKASNTTTTGSKDVHEVNDNDGDKDNKSFGNWIMHEYSLVNHRCSSSSSNDNQNYVLCRIRMKEPPKLITTTRSNANTSRVHGSINSSTTTTTEPAVQPSCSTSQILHDQQQQDHLPGAADHVEVLPLVLPTGADYQINHQDNGYLWQHPYDDQLFQQDVQQQQQQQLVLMYDQEQPAAATMEVSLGSEWECRGLDTCGGGGSSSHDDNILDMIMNLGNAESGLDNLGHDRNNYDTIMNTLKEDTVYSDLIWENHWSCPIPPSPDLPQPTAGSQFCNVTTVNRS